jgi:Tfp pilus assembly protein PilV
MISGTSSLCSIRARFAGRLSTSVTEDPSTVTCAVLIATVLVLTMRLTAFSSMDARREAQPNRKAARTERVAEAQSMSWTRVNMRRKAAPRSLPLLPLHTVNHNLCGFYGVFGQNEDSSNTSNPRCEAYGRRNQPTTSRCALTQVADLRSNLCPRYMNFWKQVVYHGHRVAMWRA